MDDQKYTVQSNAKVNLCLRITGRLPSGYHTLSSLFQEIDLHDIITFTKATNYALHCNLETIPRDAKNLCSIAYHKLKALAPGAPDWHIQLIKNIPVEAGLGGGSSNAATVLKFLNSHWNLHLPESDLIKIARQIGADVAFYLRGGTQMAAGIGDILTPLELPERFVLLLICPQVQISTPWAYRQFDLTKRKYGDKFRHLFESGKIHWELFENQFESVVFPAYPEIGNLKARLLEAGALYAGLSGSGSTVFGIFHTRCAAESARRLFDHFTSYISLPVIS
ncbi:MAG TPA: 4-(cytidine 5'-diphospho)-2-C-methyl-D-erythritol kinase [Candidatus Marinimicrobia bacterium]|nr:4-(cytidine 5'-diphospho)-2-C-methyl-D-erythritol kinase [Candidatus Neomarinimicrobiota bacterium]